MARLLLTATEDVSRPLADRLEALFKHEPIIYPLLKISQLQWQPPRHKPKYILITSRYALKAAESFKGTPLYLVGKKTAELAKAQGHIIERIGLTIDSLIPHLPADTLYLRGRDISQDLPLASIICYEATANNNTENLPAHDAAIVLSTRAAKLLPTVQTSIFCLSQQVKSGLNKANQSHALVATEPTEYELIETIKHWNTAQ